MSYFEIRAKDCLARLGIFKTEHGNLRTPLLMPVIHPGKSSISPSDLVRDFGYQMFITNSYIIRSHERFKTKALEEGVHGLLGVDVPIMTDSGTFQMYFHGLPDEEIDPLEIIRFQKEIGSDIGTILDVFSDPDVGKSKVEEDVKVSIDRARISVDKKEKMLLAGTIQGGVYPDLRRLSAKEMGKLNFDVHPIGGVVPLMERYRYADIVRATLAAKEHLPVERPVHLFGCGHPMLFPQAALLGCDLFDSASYAKFADSGRMMLTTGTVHLENMRELPCECPICSNTSADDLKQMKDEEKAIQLMKHNLYVSAAEMRRIRQAISEGKLLELAAFRARGHPNLYEALQVFLDHYSLIEESDPIAGQSSIFYTGREIAKHPGLRRFQERIHERYPYRKTKTVLLVPDLGNRPYFDSVPDLIQVVRKIQPEETLLVFITPMGVVPWELEHVHPAQQCIFPLNIDDETLQVCKDRVNSFMESLEFETAVWLTKDTPTDKILGKLDTSDKIERVDKIDDMISKIEKFANEDSNWIIRKLVALLKYQWNVKDVPLNDVHAKISRSTGKIRHVQRGDEILFTIVPTTGRIAPTFEGGELLHKSGIGEQYIVEMNDDAAPFVAEGRSALAKFILKADSRLRAGEELLLVDSKGVLLAVGRSNLNGSEMLSFKRGVAVATRHSK